MVSDGHSECLISCCEVENIVFPSKVAAGHSELAKFLHA